MFNLSHYNKAIVAFVAFLVALAELAGFGFVSDPSTQNTIVSFITMVLVYWIGNDPNKHTKK